MGREGKSLPWLLLQRGELHISSVTDVAAKSSVSLLPRGSTEVFGGGQQYGQLLGKHKVSAQRLLAEIPA